MCFFAFLHCLRREIVADFSEPFVNLLKADILSEDQLLAAFNDPEQSNAAVV